MRTITANCRSADFGRAERLRRTLAIALLTGLLASAGSIAPVFAESFLEITRTGSGFTIDAEEVSVNRILRELAAEADFETLAVFTIEDQPLPAALKSLLAKQNHLIVYAGSNDPAEPGKVTKVILMRPNAETKPGRKRPSNVSPLAGPGAKPAPKARRAPGASAAYDATRGGTAGSAQGTRNADNPEDFADPEEEFDRLLDDLEPEDADAIREAIEEEFLKNED